jgi:hypothetical protein
VVYLQVPLLGGSCDKIWHGQGTWKRSVSWNESVLCLGICQNRVNCDGATEVSDYVPHRTTYGQNNSWVVHEIPAQWLPVRCETNRPARAIGQDSGACARNICQVLDMWPKVDISSASKVGQKFGVSLPLLTCSPSAWPSQLLYRRGRKSRRDLRITLYNLQWVNGKALFHVPRMYILVIQTGKHCLTVGTETA